MEHINARIVIKIAMEIHAQHLNVTRQLPYTAHLGNLKAHVQGMVLVWIKDVQIVLFVAKLALVIFIVIFAMTGVQS